MIKLVVPEVPKSYNEIAHKHWVKKDQYNSLWRWAVKTCWLYYIQENELPELPFERAKIDFYIYFPNKHRRDKTNYQIGLKGAMDQLVTEGILIDDNWDRVVDQYYQRCDQEHSRTEIIIEEVKK